MTSEAHIPGGSRVSGDPQDSGSCLPGKVEEQR
jgi:hypothetical protein